MRNLRRGLMLWLLLGCLGALWPTTVVRGQDSDRADCPPVEELFRQQDRSSLLAAARAIIEADPAAGMITVDAEGRPRVRTVDTSEPDDDMTIWIATRPGTRKVEQIRANPHVALYFADDAGAAYVSVMGRAVLHDDLATFEAKTFMSDEELRRFWPDYPEDYLLIEVRPIWLEVLGRGIEASEETWRPQAVVFDREQHCPER